MLPAIDDAVDFYTCVVAACTLLMLTLVVISSCMGASDDA